MVVVRTAAQGFCKSSKSIQQQKIYVKVYSRELNVNDSRKHKPNSRQRCYNWFLISFVICSSFESLERRYRRNYLVH